MSASQRQHFATLEPLLRFTLGKHRACAAVHPANDYVTVTLYCYYCFIAGASGPAEVTCRWSCGLTQPELGLEAEA